MGTHSTLPSRVVLPSNKDAASHPTLSSYIQNNPSLLYGDREPNQAVGDGQTGTLPFLFKILSIGKALSIQAHPDKSLAKRLHREKPDMYKDDNHKPEMTLALTSFQGFCGFRPLKEISAFLDKVPEFRQVVDPSTELDKSIADAMQNEATEKQVKSALQTIFSRLMQADTQKIRTSIASLTERYANGLEHKTSLEVETWLAELVCTLNAQFPLDVGVLCAFVLTVVSLEPGQGMFLRANEPHAYISGDIVECMAASDNVVRAGLTPKARDVQVLIDMLTYDTGSSQEKRMTPQPFRPDQQSQNIDVYSGSPTSVPSLLYNPPIPEFAVIRTELACGQPSETHRALHGPSILIVTEGGGALEPLVANGASAYVFSSITAGQVFFIGADTRVTLKNNGDTSLVTYRAFVEA